MLWAWQVDKYLNSLRNPQHRVYAYKYLAWQRARKYGFTTDAAPIPTGIAPKVAARIITRLAEEK